MDETTVAKISALVLGVVQIVKLGGNLRGDLVLVVAAVLSFGGTLSYYWASTPRPNPDGFLDALLVGYGIFSSAVGTYELIQRSSDKTRERRRNVTRKKETGTTTINEPVPVETLTGGYPPDTGQVTSRVRQPKKTSAESE